MSRIDRSRRRPLRIWASKCIVRPYTVRRGRVAPSAWKALPFDDHSTKTDHRVDRRHPRRQRADLAGGVFVPESVWLQEVQTPRATESAFGPRDVRGPRSACGGLLAGRRVEQRRRCGHRSRGRSGGHGAEAAAAGARRRRDGLCHASGRRGLRSSCGPSPAAAQGGDLSENRAGRCRPASTQRPASGTERVSGAQLQRISDSLAARARVDLLPTPEAEPIAERHPVRTAWSPPPPCRCWTRRAPCWGCFTAAIC